MVIQEIVKSGQGLPPGSRPCPEEFGSLINDCNKFKAAERPEFGGVVIQLLNAFEANY